jgi:capsular exopolysaccharide synthesis family protein
MSNGEWPTEVSTEGGSDSRGLDFGQALLHRRWLLVFFVALGIGAGSLIHNRTNPVYASYAQLRIAKNQPIMEGGGKVSTQNALDTYAVLFCSPKIINKAYADAKLSQLPSVGSNGNAISRGLTAEPHEDADEILLVSYSGNNQRDCKQILDAIVNAFFADLDDSDRTSSAGELKLLADESEKLQDRLEAQQQEYGEFRATAGLLWTQEGGLNIHKQRLAQIETQRAALLVEQTQTRAQLEAIEAALARGASRDALLLMADQMDRQNTSQIGAGAPAASMITNMLPLLTRKQILVEKVGPRHPDVLSLEAEIKFTQQYLQEQSGAAVSSEPTDMLAVYVNSLREKMSAQDQSLAKLNELYDKETVESSLIEAKEHEDRSHRDKIELTKSMVDVYATKVQDIGTASQVGRVTAYATTLPTDGVQVAPILVRSLAMGGVAGLLLGILLAFLLEMADKSYRSPDDITRELGVPVVGHIPNIEIGKERKRLGTTRLHPSLVSYHRPGSQMAEAYRAVRTALLSGTRHQSHQLIQITSPNPGDGKSTLSVNLAMSIARAGKNVLLVDSDLRRPNVHKLLGMDNDVGVTSVVEGGFDFDDAIQSGPLPHLDVMTSGPRESNRAELLLSPRFAEMLNALRERYDYVIVDTPPVLAVSDPAAIGAMVDGVILVLRINRQARLHAVRARETLDLVGARLIGVVVNALGDSTAVQGFGTGTRGYRAATYRTLAHGYSDGYGADSGFGPNGYGAYYEDTEEHDQRGVRRDLAGSEYDR